MGRQARVGDEEEQDDDRVNEHHVQRWTGTQSVF